MKGGSCSYLEGYGLMLEQDDGTDWDCLNYSEDGMLNSAHLPVYMDELPEPDNVRG